MMDLENQRRFWAKVKVGELDECWHSSHKDIFNMRGKGKWGTFSTAKICYMEISSIITDARLMRECKNKYCCNPLHIQEGPKAGDFIGDFELIRTADRTSNEGHQWIVKCYCGNPFGAQLQSLRAKTCTGCPDCRDHKYKGLESIMQMCYSGYKGDGLSFADFYQLSQQDCDYCGRKQTNHWKTTTAEFRYNGLDRIDNNNGHTKENCVPCCWDCNRAKGTRTHEEFIAHNEEIYNHQMAKRKAEGTIK